MITDRSEATTATPVHEDEPWRVNLGRTPDAELVGPRAAWWWTGPVPVAGQCPGVGPDGTLTSLPLPDLNTVDRARTLAYFDNTWALTELIFAGLAAEEAFYRPPYHNLRHPLIFYYGHPAVLYVNKLRVAGLLDAPLDASYEDLFETGVDEMSWDDLSKNERLWPSVHEVNDYRRRVYKLVRHLIETHPGLDDGAGPVTIDDPLWALFMGFEHERIHLETSSVLIRELPVSLLQRPAAWPALAPLGRIQSEGARALDNPLVKVAAGHVALGKPRTWPSFGWDNEYGDREVDVPAFEASRHLVTNAELLDFVQAGGYREARYWSQDGWGWRTFRNAKWPTFWVPEGPQGLHQFKLRTCFEQVDLPLDWPAVVNFYEAHAYLAWRTERDAAATPYRLLTEAEHHRLRDPLRHNPAAGPSGDPTMVADGREMASRFGQNLQLAFASEGPVEQFQPAASGVYDACGNVWQWCEDPLNPLPGFAMHPYYEDFSQPCFDGRHQMILGGSFASTGDEASIWARFHFRPHFFQHAGFRVVRSDDAAPVGRLEAALHGSDVYESRQTLDEYMTLHYGPASDQMPYAFGPTGATEFPVRCAQLLLDAARQAGITGGRALEVGCAVGRSSFELARGFDEVVGFDLSQAFVETARQMRRDGRMSYRRRDEGANTTPREAVIDPAIDRTRVRFLQADACNLPESMEGYDAVLMANLLCRLPDARLLLDRLSGPHALVRPGGVVAMVSPYSWLETFTPRDAWLGGFERDGKPVSGSDTLQELLGPEFELLSQQDFPLVIREHVRKYQFIVSHAMVWRRRTT